MNADKNKQDGSFPEADEVYKAAAPRQSAARKRVSPRPAWLAERPEVRVRKDLAAFFEFFTPLHFCVAHPSDGTPRAWCSTRAINRLLSETSVSSRDRLRTALEHREPDRIPLDFGSTAVTGVHVSCVAALRRYYGLSPGPVKVHEPYQMLGLVEDDLRAAMGLDVTGVFPRKTMFGTSATDWKEWNFRGLDVLVPTNFRIGTEPNGDILIYPEGDETAAPSGRMPMGSAFLDTIVRQPGIDDERLDPEDNLEEFGPISEEDLGHLDRSARAAAASGYGVAASFGGTAFGDIALVPAPFLKNPKGIRDVTEWYISTRTRRGYIHSIFERQCEIGISMGLPMTMCCPRGREPGAHPCPHRRRGGLRVSLRHRFRHADFVVLLRGHLPRTVVPLLQARQRLGSRQYHLEVFQTFLR